MRDGVIHPQNTASMVAFNARESDIDKELVNFSSLFFHGNVYGFGIQFEQILPQVKRTPRETMLDDLTLHFPSGFHFKCWL